MTTSGGRWPKDTLPIPLAAGGPCWIIDGHTQAIGHKPRAMLAAREPPGHRKRPESPGAPDNERIAHSEKVPNVALHHFGGGCRLGHEMDLELAYKAEHRCKSGYAPAGVNSKLFCGNACAENNRTSMISRPTQSLPLRVPGMPGSTTESLAPQGPDLERAAGQTSLHPCTYALSTSSTRACCPSSLAMCCKIP